MFICLFILLAEPLTDEGGEETRVPEENPWQGASDIATMIHYIKVGSLIPLLEVLSLTSITLEE